MTTIKEINANFLSRLQEKDFGLLDVDFKDPKTNELKKVFGTMNIVDNSSSITFIYGENASGKSLIARLYQSVIRSGNTNHSVRSVSVANRTRSGIEKAMIFGDETEQSTGETSFKVMRLALNSLAKDSKEGVVILDEPDIGLSAKYSRSFGKYIADFVKEHEQNGKQLVIISHNDTFLKSVIKHYEQPYNEIGVNTSMTLNEWLDDESDYSIEDLELLPSIALEKWRGIQSFLSERKK